MAGTRLRGGFDQGWLTFECTNCPQPILRRLVPIPGDWESMPEERLEVMCKAAEEVPRPASARSEKPEAGSADADQGLGIRD